MSGVLGLIEKGIEVIHPRRKEIETLDIVSTCLRELAQDLPRRKKYISTLQALQSIDIHILWLKHISSDNRMEALTCIQGALVHFRSALDASRFSPPRDTLLSDARILANVSIHHPGALTVVRQDSEWIVKPGQLWQSYVTEAKSHQCKCTHSILEEVETLGAERFLRVLANLLLNHLMGMSYGRNRLAWSRLRAPNNNQLSFKHFAS